MFLGITAADLSGPPNFFLFTVPGDQIWTPRSFYAVADRDAGGVPLRQYTLTITDGTTPVAAVGAKDAGTDPGICDVTWTNTPAASVASGATGVSVAPLGPFALRGGYQIIGEIINAVGTDHWASAVCWYDFIYLASRTQF